MAPQDTSRLSPEVRNELKHMVLDFLKEYKASKVGYFYPNMPLEWGIGDIINRDSKVYYRDTYTFTNRIRSAARTQDLTRVKELLEICFQGDAVLW